MIKLLETKILETRLNEYWECQEAEMYRFTVEEIEDRENADRVVVKCYSDDEVDKELVWLIGVNENNDTAAMVDDLIKEMFEKYINPRNREIKAFAGYINRKLNKLDKLITKGCTDDINLLNVEMVEQYKIMKKNKSEVDFYKSFIKMIYSIKD